MLPAILILLIFAVAAALMYTRKMPALLALPLMAVLIGLVAGVSAGLPWSSDDAQQATLRALLFDKILTAGAGRLVSAMVATMFGATLSQVVMRQGIAQYLVRLAAEYAGDRKQLLALVLFFAVAACFTAVTGLGAIIMLGSLVLPILVSSGFSGLYAATVVLLGVALGGMFNPVNWVLYMDVLKIDRAVVQSFALQLGGIMLVVALFYIFFEGSRQSKVFAWAALNLEENRKVPLYALITPVLPPILMALFKWPDVPAFTAAILYGCLTTQPRRLVSNVTAALLEGIKDVAAVLGLFMGLGMALNAMMDDSTRAVIEPLLQAVLPTSPAGFVAFFTILAPLTLYRGPFNLYGLGAGFAALMARSTILPPVAVMSAFLGVGQVQSVCDPTNTHNVWIGQFVNESPDRILKHTLPYLWVYVLLALTFVVAVRGVVG